MLNLLFLIPAMPFAGFLVLVLLGRRLSRGTVAAVGAGSVGISALLAITMAVEFIGTRPLKDPFVQTLWTWIPVDGLSAGVAFLLDPLSLLMVLVITVVGFLIHLYSVEFMSGDEGYSRFFAYLNLFVGSMLTLVLADNLLLLYLGWEGVGLCSYLLISFWYKDPANVQAGRKAFIVTRAGDTALALGLFLLLSQFGTLTIRDLLQAAELQWTPGSRLPMLAAALLLGGAVGKSAQLPLQVWLPDAMVGPTPVSALIHAATMVTAGVYLIARTHVLFTLAPAVQFAVAVIGAITLLLAGTSALVQKDIKRSLAYSTISQIGYMFLALGVGAWSAALFHFMTHAFFKALLFLAAGVVILAQHHKHDMFEMGGLRRELPVTFWTFLIGAASLSALPLVTAGFYSKDLILWDAWASPLGNKWLWLAGVAGAFITALYSFRMVFLVFFGKRKTTVTFKPGWRMEVPLVVLAAGAVLAGFVELPPVLGEFRLFSGYLQPVLPQLVLPHDPMMEWVLLLATEALQAAGIALAWLLYLRRPALAESIATGPLTGQVAAFWHAGWGFDSFYNAVLVRPFVLLARTNKDDVVDAWYNGLAATNRLLHLVLSLTQTGNLRWYAMGLATGAIVFLGVVVFWK